MTKIFTIIVTYNGIHWIKRNLNSVVKSSISSHIIVIDNNSNDGTVELIKKSFSSIKLIINDENIGFGRANNIGLKYAIKRHADFVLLLNQDVIIEKNTIYNLIKSCRNKLALYSPMHKNEKGKLDLNFSKYLNSKFNNDGLMKVKFVNAAAWFLPVKIIKKIGGFDPLFPHYGEDRDFCNRMRYFGYDIYISSSSSIVHERKYSYKNIYRSKKNLLYTTGLAFVKNINNNIMSTYLKWILYRLKPIFKNLIFLKFSIFFIEIYVILRLILEFQAIKESRKKSMVKKSCYL